MAKTTTKDMTQGSIWRHLLWFALPLLFGNLFQQMYNAVDSVVVGNFVGGANWGVGYCYAPAINTLVGFSWAGAPGPRNHFPVFRGPRCAQSAQGSAYVPGGDVSFESGIHGTGVEHYAVPAGIYADGRHHCAVFHYVSAHLFPGHYRADDLQYGVRYFAGGGDLPAAVF